MTAQRRRLPFSLRNVFVADTMTLHFASERCLGINPKAGPVSIFGILTALMAIGFLVNHYNNKRTGFFGGNAWWHDFRPFHAGLWTIISILLFFDVQYAGILVLYDLLPGILDVCRGVNK